MVIYIKNKKIRSGIINIPYNVISHIRFQNESVLYSSFKNTLLSSFTPELIHSDFTKIELEYLDGHLGFSKSSENIKNIANYLYLFSNHKLSGNSKWITILSLISSPTFSILRGIVNTFFSGEFALAIKGLWLLSRYLLLPNPGEFILIHRDLLDRQNIMTVDNAIYIFDFESTICTKKYRLQDIVTVSLNLNEIDLNNSNWFCNDLLNEYLSSYYEKQIIDEDMFIQIWLILFRAVIHMRDEPEISSYVRKHLISLNYNKFKNSNYLF